MQLSSRLRVVHHLSSGIVERERETQGKGANKVYYGKCAHGELFSRTKMYISPRVNYLNNPKSLIDKGQKLNTEWLTA